MKELESLAMTQSAGTHSDHSNNKSAKESSKISHDSYKTTQQMAPPMLQMGTGKSLPELSLAEQKKKSEQKKKIVSTQRPKKTTTKTVTSSVPPTVTSSTVTSTAVTSESVTSSAETISMLEIGEEKDELRFLIDEINIIYIILFISIKLYLNKIDLGNKTNFIFRMSKSDEMDDLIVDLINKFDATYQKIMDELPIKLKESFKKSQKSPNLGVTDVWNVTVTSGHPYYLDCDIIRSTYVW